MVSLPLVPLLYSILYILAIIIVKMYVAYSGLQLPRSLVISLGSSWPLVVWLLVFCGSLSLRFCAYAFPMLLIPVETVLLAFSTYFYRFSPYLPHGLTKLARQSKILQQKPNLLLCDWSLPPSSAYVSTVPPYLHHIPVTLNY